MNEFDELLAEADSHIMATLGAPCTYLRKTIDDRISTHIVIERNVQIMGRFAEVTELETMGSVLVSDVGDTVAGDVVVFGDMSYHVLGPINNDGSIIQVQMLPDPDLHFGLSALDPMGHLNRFVQHEWSSLWQAISTLRSVQ